MDQAKGTLARGAHSVRPGDGNFPTRRRVAQFSTSFGSAGADGHPGSWDGFDRAGAVRSSQSPTAREPPPRDRIVTFVPDQPARELVDEAGIEGRSDEGNLARRSRGCTRGERKTKTVCHCHKLRTFAPLGWSHTSAPFLATTKVPSMKHSDRSSLPRSFKSRASASRMRLNVPSCTHRWNRRWHVWYGGYRSSRSAHLPAWATRR